MSSPGLAQDRDPVDVGRYHPEVGLDEGSPPESLLVEVTGCSHLFGGEQAMAEQVRRLFAEQGFTVCLAIAGTIGAADPFPGRP